MGRSKLPDYFEKYLEEKFGNVMAELVKVEGLAKDVGEIKTQLIKLNGSVTTASLTAKENRIYVRILASVLFIVSLVTVGASTGGLDSIGYLIATLIP
jgi:hypothetical protein